MSLLVFHFLRVMLVRMSCLFRSVLLPFRAWPVGKCLDVMVFLWSFTANSGVSLVTVLNSCFSVGRLSRSQREGSYPFHLKRETA